MYWFLYQCLMQWINLYLLLLLSKFQHPSIPQSLFGWWLSNFQTYLDICAVQYLQVLWILLHETDYLQANRGVGYNSIQIKQFRYAKLKDFPTIVDIVLIRVT